MLLGTAFAWLFGFLSAGPLSAQTIDQKLVAKFCAAQTIRGSTCLDAANYSNDRKCNVELGAQRYSGRFVPSRNPFLVVDYKTDCEAHASSLEARFTAD
jgi:hypothetical protein